MVLVLTGWCAQRPNGRCAGSGPETGVSACSSSLVLWIGASLSHLGTEGRRMSYTGGLCSNKDLISIFFYKNVYCLLAKYLSETDSYTCSEEKYRRSICGQHNGC